MAAAVGLGSAAIAATEPPTVMSPYEVRADSVRFVGWNKVGSPNFTVYTDATVAEATKVLREFEMLDFAGQALFGRRAAEFTPTILVLPTARSDWHKLETKGSNTEWKSTAALVGGSIVPELVAQYDWQEDGLGYMRALFARVQMAQIGIDGPFWFQRGVPTFYETAEFSGDRVTLGRASPRMFALQHASWIPWQRFFQVDDEAPEYTKEDLVQVYEGQAALFTQYLFSHRDRTWVNRLVAWLDYLRSGQPPTEAQFTAVFGEDWRKWQLTMRTYLDGGSYSVFQLRMPPRIAHCEITPYHPTTPEIRELFILSQTLIQQVPESSVSLDAMIAKGLKTDSLRELLTEACLHWKRHEAALANVRLLIAAGSKNSRVYRAGDGLLTAGAGRFGLDARMGPELKEVRAWDRQGLQLEPLDTDLANSTAINEAAAATVDQQSIMTIETCYRLIKGRGPTDRVITALAIALWRAGDEKTATALAVKLRDDPLVHKEYRAMASELLARMSRN